MKRIVVAIAVVLLAALNADFAAAENLTDKLAVSGRIGFTLPSDSEWNGNRSLTADTGVILGVGLLYGISRNLAAEVEYTHSNYDLKTDAFFRDGTANVNDLSLGLQWRFPSRQATPYVGGGLSILFNDYTDASVENTVGVNLKGGIDYFVSPRLALNAEMKLVISPTADMYDQSSSSIGHGSFDPSSFSGLFGIRYFF
ncbi:MAG: outer membrane beta-barrel protein [Desulfuromonadaceae bacterium]|nr:outer membrane beta-barrel protein [Desulfuromonadaceae bacterium]